MPQAVYVAAYPPNGVTLMRNWWAGVTSYPAWKNVRWVFSEGVYDQGSFIDPLVSAGVNVSGFLGTAPALYAGFVPPAYAEWAACTDAYFAALARRDFDAIPYADNVVLRAPVVPGGGANPLSGRETLRTVWWQPLVPALDGVTVNVID